MQNYQLLTWDSDVLGFSVAKIIPERLSLELLQECLVDLRRQHVRLVYWASDSQDNVSQQAAAQEQGFLADRKITYVIDLTQQKNVQRLDQLTTLKQNSIHDSIENSLSSMAINTVIDFKMDNDTESYTDAIPDAALTELAYQSGLYSRFKIDPRITEEQFKKIYSLWITNSTRRQIAQEVLVIKREERVVAMVTLGEKNKRGDIGLLAVDPLYRGQHFGKKLVYAAQAWCLQKGFNMGQVVTQQDNFPACALYEKCGYTVEKIENFYHFWL